MRLWRGKATEANCSFEYVKQERLLGTRSLRRQTVRRSLRRSRDCSPPRLINADWWMPREACWASLPSRQRLPHHYIMVISICGIKMGKHGMPVRRVIHFGIRAIRVRQLDWGLWSISTRLRNSTVVHTPGGKSAELKSQFKVKFAAASLYTGSFGSLVGMNGAKIKFGRSFASRPFALHGFFQYAPVAVTHIGDNQPAGTLSKGDMDVCSIYIALAKESYTVDNTKAETFIQFKTDNNIIAYGELPLKECVSTNGTWKEFTIDLEYKTLEKPNDMYLIVVASASKYGDYFTGGDGSILYVDDFELIYD